MKDLSIASVVQLVDIIPLSFAYEHRIAKATPRARSLPVEQQTRSFLGGSCKVLKKCSSFGSSFLKSRLPTLPVRHLRWR